MPRLALPVLLFCALAVGCLSAPPADYVEREIVVERRAKLTEDLLQLLPEEQRKLPAARSEAHWLSETSYKGAVAIAQLNNPTLKGWFNNVMVNTKKSKCERGLCWHYQHDMYRELRRRPLQFFRVGCGEMDHGKGSEHHCVYLAAKNGAWPDILILDAWLNNGRLKVLDNEKAAARHWQDEPTITNQLAKFYYEGHQYPLEHWHEVREGEKVGVYLYCFDPRAKQTRQWAVMQENIARGMRERKGNPVPYKID